MDITYQQNFRIISYGLLEYLLSLSMVGGQDTSDVFSTNVFASSFKIAAVCFRMIALSTKFNTGRLSKDARLMIIIGLFCSTAANNNGLSVNLDFKNLWQLLSFRS